MAAVIIPIPSDNAKFSLTVDLDEVVYLLAFTWNTRCRAWYMDIALQDSTNLLCGRKILPGVDLNGRHKDPRLPKGRLIALDTQGGSVRPDRNDLGTRIKLWYIDSDTYDAVEEILSAPSSS